MVVPVVNVPPVVLLAAVPLNIRRENHSSPIRLRHPPCPSPLILPDSTGGNPLMKQKYMEDPKSDPSKRYHARWLRQSDGNERRAPMSS